MLTKTRAIVLKTTKFGDQKLIVDLYTEVYGRMSCAIRIPKTAKGKLKKQFFQPMTLLTVETDFRETKPLQQLRDAVLEQPWTGMMGDAVKMSVAMFLSEMLWHATRQEQADKELFHFLVSSLQWLDSTERSVANFHLCFLVRLSRHLGFEPLMDDYTPASYFDLRTGTFSLFLPTHNDVVQPADAAFLPLLGRMTFRTMHLFHMTRDQRQRCLDIVVNYYRLHLPSLPELKSLAVLHDMFA